VTKKQTIDAAAKKAAQESKRVRVSQSDVPSIALSDALKVAFAISENYGGKPATPLDIAKALQITTTSSGFRMLMSASKAYGLTEGGYAASEVSLTPLAQRITRPLSEGDDLKAKIEAFLRPKIISDFCKKYDQSNIPRDDIARNILIDLGVPQERSGEVFNLILSGAQALGLISEIKDKRYLSLKSTSAANPMDRNTGRDDFQETSQSSDAPKDVHNQELPTPAPLKTNDSRAKRVFLTHGKNTAFIAPIKKLLAFGELEAVVSTEMQSVSQPVPEKVMRDMRSCGAAIIHVDGEQTLIDADANHIQVLNPNVLIEVGAAMALYGKRFILIVREGVKLPSNLQGLYEVRYNGDTLDGDATIRLLEAINQLKKEPFAIEGG
jgi:predicted nucleotide-binding protein